MSDYDLTASEFTIPGAKKKKPTLYKAPSGKGKKPKKKRVKKSKSTTFFGIKKKKQGKKLTTKRPIGLF